MIIIHKIPGRKSACSKAVSMVSPWWLALYDTATEISEMEDVLMSVDSQPVVYFLWGIPLGNMRYSGGCFMQATFLSGFLKGFVISFDNCHTSTRLSDAYMHQ